MIKRLSLFLAPLILGVVGGVAAATGVEVRDPFVDELKRYVLSIPVSSFDGDAILQQFPGPLRGITSYRHLHPRDATAGPVYETKGNDAGQTVVILTSLEDNIPLPKGEKVKRTYVILRKASDLHPSLYYVAYLYIAEAPANSPGVHNLAGRKVLLEWDFWDHRAALDFRAKSLENAYMCGNNIFIPCASNETLDFPLPKGVERKSTGERKFLAGYPTANAKKGEVYRAAEGYDPDEFIDIYGDLDGAKGSISDAQFLPPYIGRGLHFKDLQNVSDSRSMSADDCYRSRVNGVVKRVTETTLGLVKDFQGLYGGLGTIDATLQTVAQELGMEGADLLLASLSDAEKIFLEAELRANTAGGLGGLVNRLEKEEMSSDLLIDQTKEQINPWTAKAKVALQDMTIPSDENDGEKPYLQYGWIKGNHDNAADSAENVEPFFVGFGGCRYHPVKGKELVEANSPEELLRLYQRAMKTQCVSYDAEFLLETVRSGLIRFAPDKSFQLVPGAPHFVAEKLRVKELKELLRGVQLAWFSKVYNNGLRNASVAKTSPITPDGAPLSMSVYTLGQVVIYGTGYAQENIWVDLRHGFKLSRNMIRTLKVAYEKLMEDEELLGEADAALEKELNRNNRLYMMGLIQYLMRGSAPVYNSQVNPHANWEQFYVKNKQVIEDRVDRAH